jgi:CheY-like chemotaxis protein
VFDLYTQGDASIERSRGGLGIGLSLVQSLVQMHGGDVEARSAGRGKGSEFVVRLPLSGPPSAAPAAPAPRERTRTQKQHKRVLVVDDSVDQAESLSKLLALLGHEVSVARDGQQALDVAAEFQPDVALVDIGLPRMNGYEVAKRLRQQARFKNLVLVAQTGWGGTDDRQRSQDAGFDHHVVKPIDIEELTAILNTPRQPRSGGA